MIGWVTNVTEYSKAVTIPNKMMVTATTTKAQMRTSSRAVSSSTDRGWLGGWFGLFNLLLQDWRDKIFRARLRELAARFLAAFSMEVVRVLTEISILLIATSKQEDGCDKIFHGFIPYMTR